MNGKRVRKQKSGKLFTRLLTLWLAVLMLIGIGVLVYLWKNLKTYQAEIDAENTRTAQEAAEEAQALAEYRAPQNAFVTWFESTDTVYWANLWKEANPDDPETEDQLMAYFEQQFYGTETILCKAAEYTQETPVYVIQNGTETVARVIMNGSGTEWSVGTVSLEVQGTHSGTVTAPFGITVTCNGIVLPDYCAAEQSENVPNSEMTELLENPIQWEIWSINGLLCEPEMSVDYPESEYAYENEDGTLYLGIGLDGNTEESKKAADLSERAVTFVKAYLNYFMQGGTNVNSNLAYAQSLVKSGSTAYTVLAKSQTGVLWNPTYSGIDLTDTSAQNALKWADNCISIDVAYNADCMKSGEHFDYGDGTMRIWFVDSSSGYEIVCYDIL